jgi:hypothetical protein
MSFLVWSGLTNLKELDTKVDCFFFLSRAEVTRDHLGTFPKGLATFGERFVFPKVRNVVLGSLHTRAKSRDHENVRAQKKVSKGRCPNTPPTSCIVVTGSSSVV